MLAALQNRLQYQFQDEALLERALTHRSASVHHNERMEFLGDAVLGYLVADLLFQRHPSASEGELSRMRASLVRGERLAKLARTLGLGACLKLGVGEKKSGGEDRASILADAFEAMVGAVYLDGGAEVSRQLLLRIYAEGFDQPLSVTSEKDPKSMLQEWLQANRLPLPCYEMTTEGEAHAQRFHVVCSVEGLSHQTEGTSTSRRGAEQTAAKHYLEWLQNEK